MIQKKRDAHTHAHGKPRASGDDPRRKGEALMEVG